VREKSVKKAYLDWNSRQTCLEYLASSSLLCLVISSPSPVRHALEITVMEVVVFAVDVQVVLAVVVR
jgi:hypothetical protein